MEAGTVLYTNHVMTAPEAEAYNDHQDKCDKYLAAHPETALTFGTLANRTYNHLLDCKHKFMVCIAES